jgi:hypothetical protein
MSETRRLHGQIVALREVRCLTCRRPVVPDGTLPISREFQQVRSRRVQTVMFRQAGVGLQGIQQFQPSLRAWPAFMVFIIRMYFISVFTPSILALVGARSWCSRIESRVIYIAPVNFFTVPSGALSC